eukprot:GHVT01018560.1.p2 GENE.GHVT01018560.1~~GHVT01018560.1.p2  ORF type:complete len:107 (+),score=3.04 GHVT01018560.1:237-557(+)
MPSMATSSPRMADLETKIPLAIQTTDTKGQERRLLASPCWFSRQLNRGHRMATFIFYNRKRFNMDLEQYTIKMFRIFEADLKALDISIDSRCAEYIPPENPHVVEN